MLAGILFPLGELPFGFAGIVLAQILALVLDHLLGEPKHYHPLAGFGRLAAFIETRLNADRLNVGAYKKAKGSLGWALAVIPLVIGLTLLLLLLAQISIWLFWLLSALVLYFTLGLKSLSQHAGWVAQPLQQGDLEAGREKVSWLVSRHTGHMDETQINKACIESVLENGSDAVYGALFWFAVAGVPGALLYRLANTLDASWGYRTERFADYGYCAARMDDLMNLVPARICSLAYSLCGNWRNAFASWRRINHWRKNEGRNWASPNAGIVMSSGAGALNLALGGIAVYEGVQQTKPELGHGKAPAAQDIYRSVRLLYRSLALTMVVQVLAMTLVYLPISLIAPWLNG